MKLRHCKSSSTLLKLNVRVDWRSEVRYIPTVKRGRLCFVWMSMESYSLSLVEWTLKAGA